MRSERNLQIQIARTTAADAGAALCGELNLLAFCHTGRNRDAQRSLLDDHLPIASQFRRFQFDGPRAAVKRLLERDLDARDVILTGCRETATALRALSATPK